MSSYLVDAIDSTLKQTYQDFEIIVVDDGSIEELPMFTDKRIRILRHKVNKGITKALNAGIKASTGTYIAPLSADDLLTPTSLQVRLVAIQDTDLVCGQAIDVPTQLRILGTRLFYGPTNMIRRSVFQRWGLFDESLPYKMDREMWVRLFGRDCIRMDRATFHCLGDVVGFRRVSPDSFQQSFHGLSKEARQRALDLYEAAVGGREHVVEDVEFLR